MQTKLKDYNLKDTIAAVATFPSPAALGVIKISGRRAIAIIAKLFKPAKKKDIRTAATFTIHYGWIKDVDEVLVSLMRAPKSYTRQDVVEISTHGGVLVLNKILELILAQGARLAFPGEFTYRALVNGRINLFQAESVVDLVGARSEAGLKFALNQLKGNIPKNIEILRDNLKKVFVLTESLLNFPEEDLDLPLDQLKNDLSKLARNARELLAGSKQAEVIKEGLKCVICGKTNAGKSTFFNRLLKEERVIVSRTPGTTRDVVEETITVNGVPLRIYDTAGIFEPVDLISKKAIEKSFKIFDEADLVILVLDASRGLNRDDLFLLEKVKDKETIVVINKCDLKQKLSEKHLESFSGRRVYLSALKNTGLDDFEAAVSSQVYEKGIGRENVIFLSRYQRDFLAKIAYNITQAKNFLDSKHTVDFAHFALKEAIDHLGKLTGEVASEEVLESIFSQFCIGK